MRLIDADVLREEVYSWGMNDYEPSDFTDAIDDAPTIDAIPKADYENRLKADMVAMLTEVLDNVEEVRTAPSVLNDETADAICAGIAEILRAKIDKLKEAGE